MDELIVVDDGSSKPITDYLLPTKKIKIFRVVKDYGFNSHGCRNLIVSKASNNWIILMDVDREFLRPEIAYQRIRSTKLIPNVRYRFMAHNGNPFKDSHFSVNDYLIHKNHFFSAGGYDEEMIGQRWGDREFFKQLENYGYEKVLYDVDMVLTRRSSVLIGKSSPLDKPTSKKHIELVRKRVKQPEPNKPILTFEWEEIK